MKKSLMFLAAVTLALCSVSASAGGHDKGGFEPNQFVSDNHDKSFEGSHDSSSNDHRGDGNDFGDHRGSDGYKGGEGNRGGDGSYCPPTSAVPESPIWSMFLLAGFAVYVRYAVKMYVQTPRFRPQ